MSPTMVKAIGWTAPAPRPWMARNTMSWIIDWLSPHSAEPPTNRATPARKIGLRPWASARDAKTGTVVVAVSRYAANTQPYVLMPPS